MIWQWQVWRCFDDVRETFATKGWRLPERACNEVAPLAAESGGLFVVFLGLDDAAGECWFELRNGTEPPAVLLRGLDNVPAPEVAAELIAERAAALKRASTPEDRPLYEPAAVRIR